MIPEIPDWAQDSIVGEPEPPPISKPKSPAEPSVHSDNSFDPLVLDGTNFPRIASRRIRAMSGEERAAWDADRLRCKIDQLFLSDVMGLDLVETPHRAIFNFFLKKQPGKSLSSLDPRIKKRMLLFPRGVGKTFCVRVEETQLVLNYPNIRICFLSGGDELARRQLKSLKAVFQNPTDRFKYLFPEFCLTSKQNKKGEWHDVEPAWGNAHEFSVPARQNTTLAEPTCCISSARSIHSGSHFDVLCIDDIVHDKNWNSGALLEKCFQDYLSVCPLLDPKGYIIMTGTRYASMDTYERIQENAKEMGQESVWAFSIHDCWSMGCTNCSHPDVFHDKNINIIQGPCTVPACNCIGFHSDGIRGVLFPEVIKKNGDPFGHTIEFLTKTLNEQGAKFFACQYLNNPQADGEQTFTQELIGSVTLFDESQLPSRGISTTYLAGDLAYSTSMERDESVIFAFQKYAGALYVWGCWYGRWSANDRVENILNILKQTRPETAFFESNLNSDSLHLLLLSRAPQHGLAKIPIIWTPVGNRKGAKEARVCDIEAAMKGNRLFLFAKMQGYDRLIQQLLKFPNQKHDDFCDALSLVVAAPTSWQHDELPMQQSRDAMNFLHKLHPAADPEDAYYDGGCGTGVCA